MSKHAISNEKESVGAIIKKFMHVIGINHRLCKWILPCNLGKNIIMAGCLMWALYTAAIS